MVGSVLPDVASPAFFEDSRTRAVDPAMEQLSSAGRLASAVVERPTCE